MSNPSGFGAFMEGVQGGAEFGMKARRHHQEEKIYDSAIRQIENTDTAAAADLDQANADRAVQGLDALPGSHFALGDPFIVRIANMLRGRTPQKPPAQPIVSAVPTGDETPAIIGPVADVSQFGQADVRLADGRKPPDFDSPDEIKARAARARAAAPPERAAGSVEGDPKTYRPAEEGAVGNAAKGPGRFALPEGAGMTRRFINSAGKKAAPIALGVTAADVYNTPTEDYRKRFGLETNDPGFWSDAGVRTLGAASDLGNALTFGLAGNLYRDKQQEGAIPAPAAAAAPAQVGGARPPPRGGRGAGSGAGVPAMLSSPSAGGATAAPAGAVAAAPDPSQMDFSGMSPMEVPDFKTRDWEKFRANAVSSAVLRGMSYADAVDKVDQQVIGMQMRGFQTFANQGMALQQAGNLRGAAAAYRAAFQYFPTTTDVRFAKLKGHLVAYGVDEDTGKPEGRPWVVNPETLSVAMQNFSTPGAWAAHAQDRRRIDIADKQVGIAQGALGLQRRELGLKERRLDQVEIPATQALMDSRLATGEAAMARAMGGAGGGGGMSTSGALASDKDVRSVVVQMAMAQDADGNYRYPELQNPDIQNQLLAAIMKVRRLTGRPTEDILNEILSRSQTGQ